jgi:hypothetical protein
MPRDVTVEHHGRGNFAEFERVLACAWRLAGICEPGGVQLHDVNEPVATQMATAPSVDDLFGQERCRLLSVSRSKEDQVMHNRRQPSRLLPKLRLGSRERGLVQLQAARVGAAAVGAAAVGAGAIGALAIGRLAVGRAVVRRLKIEELEVTRLHVHQLRVDEQPTTTQA